MHHKKLEFIQGCVHCLLLFILDCADDWRGGQSSPSTCVRMTHSKFRRKANGEYLGKQKNDTPPFKQYATLC